MAQDLRSLTVTHRAQRQAESTRHLAVGVHGYGGEEVLGLFEREARTPGPGEVLVRVATAAVNPTDLLLRRGLQAERMRGFHPPFVPGLEFAGEVYAVGDGVRTRRLGDRVMGLVSPARPDGGAQARFVTVPSASLVPVPEGMAMPQAATILMNGATALLAMDLIHRPRRVLVTGGAGAVGGYVVQLASRAKAEVVAIVAERDEQLVRSLGATTVLPRDGQWSVEDIERGPEGFDAVVDASGTGEGLRPVLRTGGLLVRFRRDHAGSASSDPVVNVLDRSEDPSFLSRVRDLAADGDLKPRVAEVLAPSGVAEAHFRLAAGGLRGRLVLSFDGAGEP